jgi:hypothetical protein
MMNDVKTDLRMKLDGLSVSQVQPRKVSNREAYVTLPVIPKVQQTRGRHPAKFHVRIGVFRKKFLDTFAVMRTRQNPNPVPLRELQCPIPRKAGFRTHARTTSITDEQDLHYLHRLP